MQESHPSPNCSQSPPDVCRKVTRAIGQIKVRNVLLQQSRLSKRSLDHQTPMLAPSGGGHVSGRETGKGRAHSGIVTPSSNQDWRWLESRPLTSSSPLTERQRYWTRSSPGRNDRAAGNVSTFLFSFYGRNRHCCAQMAPDVPWILGHTWRR